jgi:hypothetical protein
VDDWIFTAAMFFASISLAFALGLLASTPLARWFWNKPERMHAKDAARAWDRMWNLTQMLQISSLSADQVCKQAAINPEKFQAALASKCILSDREYYAAVGVLKCSVPRRIKPILQRVA